MEAMTISITALVLILVATFAVGVLVGLCIGPTPRDDDQ